MSLAKISTYLKEYGEDSAKLISIMMHSEFDVLRHSK